MRRWGLGPESWGVTYCWVGRDVDPSEQIPVPEPNCCVMAKCLTVTLHTCVPWVSAWRKAGGTCARARRSQETWGQPGTMHVPSPGAILSSAPGTERVGWGQAGHGHSLEG